MSYLLDALRKAEHERKLGDPSALQPNPGWRRPLPALDRRWYVAILALSAALALLAAALLATREPSASAHPAPIPPPPTAPTPDAGGPRSFDELGVPPAPAIPESPEEEMVREAAPEPAPAGPAPVAAPQPLKVAESARARPTPAPAANDAVEETSLAEDPSTLQAALDAPAPVAALREMPLEYRAGFPTPSIEVHVYEALPQRRWIMSGGKRYREGDSLPQGQRIAEITRDSVIFDFRGQQARVPVGR